MTSSSGLLWGSCRSAAPVRADAMPSPRPWQPRLFSPLATCCRRQADSDWGLPRAAAKCWHSSLRMRPGMSTTWRIAAEDGDRPKGEQQQRVEPRNDGSNTSSSGDNEVVKSIEALLSKAFGGVVWFGVLAVSLGIFAGGYVYLIYNYADLADIPILRGPQGH